MPIDDAAEPIAERLTFSPQDDAKPVRLALAKSSPAAVRTDMLVVGVYADGSLTPDAEKIDTASKGRLSALLKRGDLETKAGSTLLLYDLPGTAAQRVLVVSLGPRDKFGDKAFRDALAGAARAIGRSKASAAAVTLAGFGTGDASTARHVRETSRALANGFYRFNAPKAPSELDSARRERDIMLVAAADVTPELEAAVRAGEAIAEGMALARDLGNLPGNVCTPAYLADTARSLGTELGLDVEVLEREDMAKLGMNAALSVGRASGNPCKLIVMRYRGGTAAKQPIVLIGKGVTFDTGGVSLKPGEDLDMMKYDMCGAASVFGAMKVAARLALPIDVVGLVNAVENMPGGDATRPGDVVTSMSGQTIEILNTDAEGRLGLCDVLTYAERFDPECVVDIATLTGACVIALGNVASGLFANDDALAAELFDCGLATGDRAWQLPLWDDYQEQLKSNFADMSNLGGRAAGSVTAACFLARYAQNYRWAHLDIAGTNAIGGDAKGATGRPVPLLSEFLLRRSQGITHEARPS